MLTSQPQHSEHPPPRRRYRLAYLVSHPIQYQAPLLRVLAADESLDLTVFFLSDISARSYKDPGFGTDVRWDVPLLDGYRHEFLPVLGGSDKLSFWRPVAYGLRQRLQRGRFDALWVHGYGSQSMLRAIMLARFVGLKVLMRGESHLAVGRRTGAARVLKNLVMPKLFAMVDAFLAIGTYNRDFYLNYGVPAERIFSMPYAVDNVAFSQACTKASAHREVLCAEHRLEAGRPIILFASKFLSRKRPGDLLEAYAKLSHSGAEPRPYLLFIGDGEERAAMERRAQSLGWGSIRFLGFKNQTELPRYYDLCDVFVLPSVREPWGLVVNEAMAAGKAVIASDEIGAAADLVQDGRNGFVYAAGDVDALAQHLGRLTEAPEIAAAMGAESRKIIRSFSFEEDRRGLLKALRYLLEPDSQSSSLSVGTMASARGFDGQIVGTPRRSRENVPTPARDYGR